LELETYIQSEGLSLQETPMLNLKALTVAVVIGASTFIVPMNILSESSVLAQSQEERKAEADRLLEQGIQRGKTQQFQEALQSFQEALKIYREIGNRNGEAKSLGNLGMAYEGLGQYQQAIEFYWQQLMIAREIDNRNEEVKSLYRLGIVYFNLKQYQQAIEFYQQSLVITRKIGDRFREAGTLNTLGLIYDRLGQDQKAIEFHQQSLAIAQELGFRPGIATSLNNLGIAYEGLGQYQKAIEFHRQSLMVKQELGDRAEIAASLNNLGSAYYNLGQYQQALEFHKQSLAIQKEIGGCQACSLNNLGAAYEGLGQYQKALESYQESLVISKKVGNLGIEALTLQNIGYLLEKQNQPKLAIAFLKQSVNTTESIRYKRLQNLPRELQQSYIDSISGRYRRLADLLLKENRVLEAQRVLDLLKVQELEDYLKNVRGNANTAGGIEFYQPEQEILARYNELQQNVIKIGEELAQLQQKENLTPSEQQRRNQLDKILTEVKQQFNEFARSSEVRALIEQLSFEAQEQTLSLGALDRLRDKLGELDAVLFYPLILEERLELVITTPNSPPLRRTVNVSREELYRTIVRFRLALQDPTIDAVAPAQKLYRWLFEPLEEDLKAADSKVIIYAPDGVLRYIPLVALHDGQRWLAERFRVNNITAASLEEIDTQPQPEPRVLAGAFADESLIRSAKIGERDVQFAGLPFAGVEVAVLQNTLTNTTAYVDEAFTLEAIKPKMNGYNVLHFATHAAFVPGDPSESFIVFGEGENPTLQDVENWSLSNVDLVVLSACETGLGGFDNNGEQILGLGYQFQNQGARAVLASLWKVSDGGTQVLMNVFYNALQQGYSKTEALQIAQRSLIAKNTSTVVSQKSSDGTIVFVSAEIELPANIRNHLDHPYYWASFILIGNGL
jgi:CHAT domain-containing protein/Flp pilus assembly protein TadD